MTTDAKFDLSAVGELNLDLILYGLPAAFELDREYLASDVCLTLGSSSAIFAHNFALLGNRVAFHSVVGDDPLGEICVKRLGESGADSSGVRRAPGRQTGLTVVLPQPQKRFILTYLGVMAEMSFEDLDLTRVFNARHLHLSSIFLQRALRPRVAELFRLAKEAGLSTSLDTNDDPENRWDEDVLEVLPWVDVLLPNEEEACRLARTDDPARAAELLTEKGPLVVMKRGARGAFAQKDREIVELQGQKIEPVDTVGAGDSFDAGFLHQFIRKAPLGRCLEYGNLAGALSTTRSGGTEAFRDADHRRTFMARAGSA
jgi:sugar/nucleoside kinase (ribokinase family)